MIYGQPPQIIKRVEIPVEEMLLYQYLPIKMPNDTSMRVPQNLKIFMPLIGKALLEEVAHQDVMDKYIYLTVKNRYVKPNNWINREGWHSDGFGTDDVNYIWCNKYPTIFAIGELKDVSDDCGYAMKLFNSVCGHMEELRHNPKTLLRLTPSCLHKVDTDIKKLEMRCFVKISISSQKYNLKGNSHNYLFDYNWKMHDRGAVRNHPTKKESDFVEV